MSKLAHLDKRVIVYPNYLDNRKTVAQGRRIPKELACEAPNALEILECIQKGLNLEAEAEMKSYPRDWLVPGRVRVKLRNDDGSLCNPDIPTRRELLLKIANLVPRHPGRVNGRPAAVAAAVAKQQEKAGGSGGGSSAQQKKKGKKK
ncbi:signal recognition particle 19 kDa -like [Micractinium conductrix]|uniref:Signal recognition particle 19 kDa -like n=1 Tax=Micractinium conductrix TaxID=554055 RepID=A0A2P6VDL4_9CHLO|nr:signal recognition particle 19 kDa -like [Micractinium conductrix]|eukprot:PSC72194.1 signal recognition particle 19 kDa -like [Micractinium conductrix]